MKPLAIYIHVPFCKRKCVYCDFASFANRESMWELYFEKLGDEIDCWAEQLCAYEARSVFFGGGTPSLVDAELIARILERLRKRVRFAAETEITLEANPGTLTDAKLRTYRDAGINRLSLGVQSFDAGLLKSLGRIHTPEEAESAVLMAKDAGFDNISIDLMYALPSQTTRQWERTLERAVSLPIRHVSAYSLIVESGTEMARRVAAGEAVIPDDERVNEMQRMAVRILSEAGYARYEISNFAQPGYESRHNCVYWTGGEYLGLGAAAHSLMDNARFSNPPQLERYLAGERMRDYAPRTLRDRKEETLMLETRMTRGLNLDAWRENFREDFIQSKAKALKKLENCGLIEVADGFMRLTQTGLEVQDSVVLELMEDMD